jgi:predicted esterase
MDCGPVTIHTIEARTHGRYLVEPRDAGSPLLVGFHGHAENAEIMLENLHAISAPASASAEATADKGGGWTLLSVQALHRFYTKRGDVVATWMTKQDRELEIADNTAYVWSVVERVRRDHPVRRPLVFAGFSQGVAMAYRAAAAGESDGLIILAGDVPPDVAPRAPALPPILLGRGKADEWYTEDKAAADLEVLQMAGVDVTQHVFDAGHLWDPSFIAAARTFLARIASPAARRA